MGVSIMSGGSWDYVCYRLEDAAQSMSGWDTELSEMLKDLADIAHDCEWADSCDIGKETPRRKIVDFKRKWFSSDAQRTERLKGYVNEELAYAQDRIYRLLGIDPAEQESADE